MNLAYPLPNITHKFEKGVYKSVYKAACLQFNWLKFSQITSKAESFFSIDID